MKSKPAATNASSRANEVFSSAVQPNTLPPKQNGATCRSERPSRRFFISDRDAASPCASLGGGGIRAEAGSGLRQRRDHLADVARQRLERRRLRQRRLIH